MDQLLCPLHLRPGKHDPGFLIFFGRRTGLPARMEICDDLWLQRNSSLPCSRIFFRSAGAEMGWKGSWPQHQRMGDQETAPYRHIPGTALLDLGPCFLFALFYSHIYPVQEKDFFEDLNGSPIRAIGNSNSQHRQ